MSENTMVGMKQITTYVEDHTVSSEMEMASFKEDGEYKEISQIAVEKEKEVTIWESLKNDRVLRLRILHTVLISWMCFAVGWRLAMIGPTFPDLMQITKVDVSVGSWLLTAFYIGNITGSLCAGILYDRFTKIFVIVGIMLLLSVTTALVPFCTSFTLMLIIHVLGGISYGAADVVTIADVIHVWGSRSSSVLQFVQFIYSIGAIISPLVSAPFLSTKIDLNAVAMPSNMSSNGHFVSYNNSPSPENVTQSQNDNKMMHVTKEGSVYAPNMSVYDSMVISNNNGSFLDYYNGVTFRTEILEFNTSTTGFHSNSSSIAYGDSRIHLVYWISACISLINAAMFVLYYQTYKNVYREFSEEALQMTTPSNTAKRKKQYNLSTRTKGFFVGSVAVLLMFNMIIERNFTSYLTNFLSIKMAWDKTTGSTATSAYWIASAISRLIAAPLLASMRLAIAMAIYLLISMVGALGFLVTLYIKVDSLIWIAVLVFGSGLAPLFSCWFTWLSENVILASGKITGAIYITGVIGCSFVPPLIGYLMKNYTYDWFVYMLLICVPCMLLLFIVVSLIHRYAANK